MANKKRLIDVNAFRKFWNNNYRHQYANETFLFALVNFPTVDATEVVHGEWIHHYYDSGEPIDDKWYCSECHMCNDNRRTWYCPNCGAKMDGDGNA